MPKRDGYSSESELLEGGDIDHGGAGHLQNRDGRQRPGALAQPKVERQERIHTEGGALADMAGLSRDIKHCIGVIAITNDDHANLTIAITSKLLRPDLPVLARSETRRVVANMASFGTDITVDPYTIFAERFYMALMSPVKYLVHDWLISVPGTQLRTELNPPHGRWLLAGLGRFGSRMAARLRGRA